MPPRAKRQKVEKEIEDPDVSDGDEVGEEEGPPSIDPYSVLGLDAQATSEDVKKAYRKMALKHHPDKAADADKATAHQKFQEVAFAYAVLSDEQRRKRYDLTGSTAESIEDDADFDWHDFYRTMFDEVVSEENIKRIALDYKGSAEERRDLINAYNKHKGKLDKVYDVVMLSDILEDDDRFRSILDDEIVAGNIESFKVYERDNNDAAREKVKAAERKRREDFDKKHGKDAAEKAKAKQGRKKKDEPSSMGDLAALIQSRQQNRGNAFDRIAAKYTSKPAAGEKRGSAFDDMPSEEAFQATRKRMGKK